MSRPRIQLPQHAAYVHTNVVRIVGIVHPYTTIGQVAVDFLSSCYSTPNNFTMDTGHNGEMYATFWESLDARALDGRVFML